jgi:hypothetical protein
MRPAGRLTAAPCRQGQPAADLGHLGAEAAHGLGEVVATRGALDALRAAGQPPLLFNGRVSVPSEERFLIS